MIITFMSNIIDFTGNYDFSKDNAYIIIIVVFSNHVALVESALLGLDVNVVMIYLYIY